MIRKILFLFSFFIGTYCFSQDFWEKLPLPNTNISIISIAVNSNNRLYLGTNQGVFFSENLGQDLIQTGLGNPVSGLTINRRDELFAFKSANMYFSDDSGNNWSITGLPDIMHSSYYVKEETVIIGGWGFIYKSDDMGATWKRCIYAEEGSYITCFKQSSNGLLFAGIKSFFPLYFNSGIICSKDNGDTWTRSGLNGNRINAIAQNSKGTLFAATHGSTDGISGYEFEGLWMSNDFGQSWTPLLGHSFETNALVIDKNDVIYRADYKDFTPSGVSRSLDNGNSWEALISGMDDKKIKGLLLTPDGYLYAFSNESFYRSASPVFDAVYSVSATANPVDGGEISGNGTFNYGETATLTATPNTDYEFENWTSESGEILSDESTYSFEVTHNMNLTANFKTPTSIGELSIHTITVYPNPVSDYLYIGIDNAALSLNNHSITVTLYDIAGRLALKSPIKEGKVNLSSLSAGIYNLSIEYDGKTVNQKIVKR